MPTRSRPVNNACECCDVIQKRRLFLDHCHNKQVFRGWLCNTCNISIGGLGDDVEGLRKAIKYLQRTKTYEQ